MTFTRERLEEIIHAAGLDPCDYEAVFDSIKTGEIVAMARIALASLEAEPVAYIRDGFRTDGVHFCGGIITAEEHERTKAALSDRYYWKHQTLYATPPALISEPDELTREEYKRRFMEEDNFDDTFRGGWNACRTAMLQSAEPVTTAYKLPEGWVQVPIEPTDEMWQAALDANGVIDSYKAMISAAPQQE